MLQHANLRRIGVQQELKNINCQIKLQTKINFIDIKLLKFIKFKKNLRVKKKRCELGSFSECHRIVPKNTHDDFGCEISDLASV